LAIIYSDSFSGVNGSALGFTEVGNLEWNSLSGSWVRAAGLASTSAAISSNPIAIVDVGWPDIDESVSISSIGGDALYWRVTDVNNWFRLRLESVNVGGTQVPTGIYNYTSWVLYTSGPLHPGDDAYNNGSGSSYSNYVGGQPTFLETWGNNYIYGYSRHAIQHYTYSGTTTYLVVTEKSVAGVITKLSSVAETDSVISLRVVAQGSALSVYYNGLTVASLIDSTFLKVTQHGVGRGGPTDNDGSALDNFSLTAVGLVPNAPVLTYPINDRSIDLAADQLFTYNFSDPALGSSQSQVTVYYRLLGTTSWTSQTFITADPQVTFPANTFRQGNYEWQAETYDQLGNVGARSDSATFSALPAVIPSNTLAIIEAQITSVAVDYGLINVSWVLPVNPFPHFRLLRSTVGNAVNELDGELLGDETTIPTSAYADTTATGGVRYYYTLIFGDQEGDWFVAGATSCLAISNQGYGDLLYSLTPGYFRYGATNEITDAGNAAVENAYLATFMKVFGWGFDQIKGYYDDLLNLNNTNATSVANLENLAEQLGAPFEATSSIGNMRNYVGSWSALMREKGTLYGLRDQIRLATGWDTDVFVGQNLMLDEDQASFVNPAYPMWANDVSYQTGDRVEYGNFVFEALLPAYGDAQYPRLTPPSAPSVRGYANPSSTTIRTGVTLFGGGGTYNIISQALVVPSNTLPGDLIVVFSNGNEFDGVESAQPYGEPSLPSGALQPFASRGFGNTGGFTEVYAKRAAVGDAGQTINTEVFASTGYGQYLGAQSVLIVLADAALNSDGTGLDSLNYSLENASATGGMPTPVVGPTTAGLHAGTTTINNDLIIEQWFAYNLGGSGGLGAWSTLPDTTAAPSGTSYGLSNIINASIGVSSRVQGTAGAIAPHSAAWTSVGGGSEVISVTQMAFSPAIYWKVVSTVFATPLINPVTGNQGTWEALDVNGKDIAGTELALGVISPADDTNHAYNALAVNYTGPTEDVYLRSISLLSQQTALDPYQPMLDGIPLPTVTDLFNIRTEYERGALVYFEGYTYQALLNTRGVYPPLIFSTPNDSWECVGVDRKVSYTASMYAHTADFSNVNTSVAATVFIEWYDIHGALITRLIPSTGTPYIFDGFGSTFGNLVGRDLAGTSNTWLAVTGNFLNASSLDGVAAPADQTTRSMYLTQAPGTDGSAYVSFRSNISNGTKQQALIVRGDGTTANYVKATRTQLISVVSSAPTVLATYTSPAGNGDRLKVRMVGSVYTVYVNGVQVATATSSANTGTYTGMAVE
jgi:hypothetical protein